MGFQLKSHNLYNFVAVVEMCLCGTNLKIVPRLLLDCIEVAEARFLQMGNITESQSKREMKRAFRYTHCSSSS